MLELTEKVHIIIATYNGMPWLPRTFAAIPPEAHVVVVDNNSSDGTVEFITKNYPKTTIFPQQRNLGFGKANNIGMSHALAEGAKFIFLLNQDAYLEPGSLSYLLRAARDHPKYAVLSPVQLNGDGTVLDRNFAEYISFQNNELLIGDALKNTLADVYEVPFLNAAAWLMSTDAINSVGGFDPIFFHYGEDNNYCQRLRYHGFLVGVVPKAFVLHDRFQGQKEPIKIFSESFFPLREKHLKVRFADINHSLSLLKYIKFNLRLLALAMVDYTKNSNEMKLSNLLTIYRGLFRGAKKELVTIIGSWSQIKNSRAHNSKVGRTYL